MEIRETEERVLNKEFFKNEFGTWWPQIEPFFDEGGFEPIYARLKQDSKDGRVICPLSRDTFECFRATPIEEVKVVLMGMSPYHTMFNKIIVSDGLLMSCSKTNRLQPSLEQFYGALEEEYSDGSKAGIAALNMMKTPDLHYLSTQGVFMFNASLTTELNKAGSHEDIWTGFTAYLLDHVISRLGVPVIFLGKSAARYEKCLAPFQWTFKLSHPASASYRGEKWSSEGVFKKVDKILFDKDKTIIAWFMTDLPWKD